jgi:hypothetical protein
MPVIGFLSSRSPFESEPLVAAFRRGLSEAGFAEGRNTAIEYHWAENRYDRLPSLVARLVSRNVAVIDQRQVLGILRNDWIRSAQREPERQRDVLHSMTSSARARIDGGTVRPSACAALRLTTSSSPSAVRARRVAFRAGRHCRLAEPGRPTGSSPRILCFEHLKRTCTPAERRAQRQSRMPPRMRRHRRSRRKASLTKRARCYPCPGGIASQGVTRGYRPAFLLDHWWEVRFLQRGVRCEPDSSDQARRRIPARRVTTHLPRFRAIRLP